MTKRLVERARHRRRRDRGPHLRRRGARRGASSLHAEGRTAWRLKRYPALPRVISRWLRGQLARKCRRACKRKPPMSGAGGDPAKQSERPGESSHRGRRRVAPVITLIRRCTASRSITHVFRRRLEELELPPRTTRTSTSCLIRPPSRATKAEAALRSWGASTACQACAQSQYPYVPHARARAARDTATVIGGEFYVMQRLARLALRLQPAHRRSTSRPNDVRRRAAKRNRPCYASISGPSTTTINGLDGTSARAK